MSRSARGPQDRPLVLALISALLLWAAMPGYLGWWPLLFPALAPLLYLCLWHRPGSAFVAGFAGGFCYQILTVHWLVVALVRYGGLPTWAGVATMLLLAAYLALYQGAFCFLLSFLAGRYWHRERSVAVLVWTAPVLWVGLDGIRGRLLTGFPWLDLGYGLYRVPELLQAADLGGHHLLTFWLVLANGLALALYDRQRTMVHWDLRRERRALALACCFLIFVGGYSMLTHRMQPALTGRGVQTEVAVIQGNIGQDRKWDAGRRAETVAVYEQLTAKTVAGRTTELVVWPETALPFYPQVDPLAARVADLVRQQNIYLLTGAPTFRGTASGRRFYNSALLIDPDGVIRGIYSKRHLVPVGEYVPLRRLLGFLSPVVENIGDFSPGESGPPLALGGQLRLGILICFESIFPEIARDQVAAGATLLVNLTNDAWYGRSSAPVQSLAMAVLRAVENNRSLVRAANTGISGFIAPDGVIVRRTGLFKAAGISARVPVMTRQSMFTRGGYRFGPGCAALIPVFLLFRRRLFEA